MFVQQFFVPGLAHSSYLLAGTSTCAIVDPRRDVAIYREAAASRGMNIIPILQTHLHADFVSGHRDLEEATGAAIVAPRAGTAPSRTSLSPRGTASGSRTPGPGTGRHLLRLTFDDE